MPPMVATGLQKASSFTRGVKITASNANIMTTEQGQLKNGIVVQGRQGFCAFRQAKASGIS
jgi:hypothetical protein